MLADLMSSEPVFYVNGQRWNINQFSFANNVEKKRYHKRLNSDENWFLDFNETNKKCVFNLIKMFIICDVDKKYPRKPVSPYIINT